VLAAGNSQQLFTLTNPAADHARVLLSALQGALLIARASGDHDAFNRTTSLLISGLTGKG